ncbi:MAG: hypothetical protein S4CHLAM37_02330 [Chlamydiia bacterium]|nr:hypothetical protein [Chlamydiia bacterium]
MHFVRQIHLGNLCKKKEVGNGGNFCGRRWKRRNILPIS